MSRQIRWESPIDVLTVGRVGVDLYPEQSGPLKSVTTFRRFLGGTATNVAVGAARLGRRTAVLTKVGADGFGDYVREALTGFGVDATYVGTAEDLQTPIVFCALDPPEDPPLTFYRSPKAPDLTLRPEEVPWDLVADVPLLWVTGTGASTEPARSTQAQLLSRRARPRPGSGRWTVLDLDWRPAFWSSVAEARTHYAAMLDLVTVTVGNRIEIEVAAGTDDPEAGARQLLERGLELVVVKLGAEGVLLATPQHTQVIAPHRVAVVCGLGAGDAFGAALAHGLLAGWPPEQCVRYANAAGAIVASRLACADAMPTGADVEALLAEAVR